MEIICMRKYIVGIIFGVSFTAAMGVFAFQQQATMQGNNVTLSCPGGQHINVINETCGGQTCNITSIGCS
jgi:hypothetical protein